MSIPSLIDSLRERFGRSEFEFARHAVDQSMRRRISVSEIRQAVRTGEIIEDYPRDKYGPSCLVFGKTDAGRPIHIHCSYPERSLVKLITVYEPNPQLWINFRTRNPTP